MADNHTRAQEFFSVTVWECNKCSLKFTAGVKEPQPDTGGGCKGEGSYGKHDWRLIEHKIIDINANNVITITLEEISDYLCIRLKGEEKHKKEYIAKFRMKLEETQKLIEKKEGFGFAIVAKKVSINGCDEITIYRVISTIDELKFFETDTENDFVKKLESERNKSKLSQ